LQTTYPTIQSTTPIHSVLWLVVEVPSDTGLKLWDWTGTIPDPVKGFPFHVWLTWDGYVGSIDANALDSGIVRSPAIAPSLPFYKAPPPHYGVIRLSPCEYDFEKLNRCLDGEAAILADSIVGQAGGATTDLCIEFVVQMLGKCMSQSKGCTAK
jgi:hypothetical protein